MSRCKRAPAIIDVVITMLYRKFVIKYFFEQTYGCRAPWEDMADWVMDTYPWSKATRPTLLRLRPEDVGYEAKVATPGGDKTTKSDRPTEVFVNRAS